MDADILTCATLPDLLRLQADRRGDELLYRFLSTGDPDGAAEEWTFADFERRARGIGALLQEVGAAGERALLVYPPGLEFIEGFMGCLCAGAVAVPTYPPDPTRLERTLPRLRAIAQDSGAKFVLTTTQILAMAEAILPAAPELAALRWVATDAPPPELASAFRAPRIEADALAFLQYTSGSTGDPRGVMITHANVLHNERAIARAFRHDTTSRGVGWLPLFHDMGLIGNVLQPLYTGFSCTLMSPLAFLQQPLRWLRAISRFRATTSGGPNFAYELCVRKIRPEDRASLDLSSWNVAFNGAEPVRSATLDRFAEAFAPCGFDRASFYPCYGLAESTLIVSGAESRRAPVTRAVSAAALGAGEAREAREVREGDGPARPLVSSGQPALDQRILVVDPATGAPLPAGKVGEIWTTSPSVALGYWGRAEETARAFGARLASGEGPFLRTGDLGFVLDGELFITGRSKDVIILRGRNHYPQDIEQTVEAAHPAVRAGCVAAFALEVDGAERLGVAAEIDPGRAGGDPGAVGRAIQQAIAGEHGLQVHVLALLPPQGIPKTSSGKIQRRATAQAVSSGTLPELLRVEGAAEAADGEGADGAFAVRDALEAAPAAERGALILTLLRHELARELQQDPARIDAERAPAELGLDSLGMLSAEGRIEGALGIALPPMLLWRHRTLTAAAEELCAAWEARQPDGAPDAPGADAPAAPGVSSGQARLWFLDRLMPENAAYHVHAGLRMSGPLDTAALERSLAAVVERHAVLRTSFVAGEDGAPRAQVAPPAPVALPRVDLRSQPAEARAEALQALSHAEGTRPFDLEAGPLFRATLARVADDEHVLLLTVHHTVTDGWSMGILTRELAALYVQARKGEAPRLPPAPRYDDYVRHARARGRELDAQRAFWKGQLAGLPRLDLPIARTPSGPPSTRGATVRATLPAELVEGVRRIARERGTTLFAAMIGAFGALLHRYSGQSDLGIGTVVANRGRREHQSLVGFLTNTLVIRLDLAKDPSFLELIERSRRTVSEALARAELPFDEVVRACRAAADADNNPLFQVAFMMESLPPLDLSVPGMRWETHLDVPDGSLEDTAKFDLALMMVETPAGASLAFQYSADRFDAPSIERLVAHFEVLLRGLVSEPARRISALPLLTAEERRRIVHEWNATALDFPRDACVHRLFEAQVARTPGATAVTFGDASLSYAELDARASRLAARLLSAGVGREARVGLYVERSLELAVGLLGILKAGAAYVPLDPAYPADRVAFVLTDASVAALVTQEHLAPDLPDQGCPVLCLDGPDADDEGAVAPSVEADPRSLAYVIYTSGSTGRPKGVMLSHLGVVSFFASMDERIGAQPPGVFLALTSVSFDISVLELLWTVTRGFHVVIHPEQRTAALRAGSRSRAAEFSLFYFADDEERGGSDRFRLLLEGARFADENGFAAVWTPERHFHAFGGLYTNPSVTGAAVAAVTRRVGIRAGSVVLPLHNPVRVAEEWSMVDNLSGGRVGISVASGWHADDFALAPGRYERRREAMMEDLALIRRFWRGEPVSLPNGAGQMKEFRLRPRPVQRELPVWLTAAGNPETFRVAGEIGANVLTHLLGQSLEDLREKIALYREARRRAGHEGAGHVTLMLHAFVERDMEIVREKAAEPFRRYLKSSLDLMRGFGRSVGIDVDASTFSPADLDALVGRAHERFFAQSGLFGTPRSCEEMVGRIEELGVDEIACLVDFGVETESALGGLRYLDALRRRALRRPPASVQVPAQIAAHGVTHVQCTPSFAQALLLDPDAEGALASLRALLVGGEALPTPLAARLTAAAPGRVINMYGPTETTIWSATRRVEHDERGAVVSIGTPIGNTSLYVLDARLEPLPVGVPGELYIGGVGLARGYHARPALTAERFVPDPFAGEGARMYRTGDLARYRPDGSIEFLGRSDQQIKLRGFRIELGEIEARIAEHPGVRDVAVAVREERPGDQRLVAYVVPRGDAAPDAEELQRFARQRLPEYMVPSAVVRLQAMPLTPNGKLDRKALPALGAEPARPRQAFAAARNDMERQIAAIWTSVLGVPEVGIHDNFFDLGGHSLLLAQVHARVRASLRSDLPLMRLIEHPTVASLARHLSEEPAAAAATVARSAQDRARQQMEALRRQRAREPKR
ncbi:MupA/Atu3671 family FMN-dependent luciferase-like monooxygenase [Sorangium sp. So ce1335]|uniref:MupA/Atu3671 family FMN-dependent luciferase-like monooxygenase n=1 Tax=Sorangium sp. So ce1335 TaxID=3133335 RepID=UPI003F5E3EE0